MKLGMSPLARGGKKEPTIDELVTRLVRYIEVRAKDVAERMERTKVFNARVKRQERCEINKEVSKL